MIVVVGSRHDPVAKMLVDAWPAARQCSAEDFTRPGWAWRRDNDTRRWVIDGITVDDAEVSGVFVRRSMVYPEEFMMTHPDDRGYLAAETSAFLVFVLSCTSAVVVNPVVDGAFGDEVLVPERWIPEATASGVTVAPVRLTSSHKQPLRQSATRLEVVGTEVIGAGSSQIRSAASSIVNALGLRYAVLAFDDRERLVCISCMARPSHTAVEAIGQMLIAA